MAFSAKRLEMLGFSCRKRFALTKPWRYLQNRKRSGAAVTVLYLQGVNLVCFAQTRGMGLKKIRLWFLSFLVAMA